MMINFSSGHPIRFLSFSKESGLPVQIQDVKLSYTTKKVTAQSVREAIDRKPETAKRQLPSDQPSEKAQSVERVSSSEQRDPEVYAERGRFQRLIDILGVGNDGLRAVHRRLERLQEISHKASSPNIRRATRRAYEDERATLVRGIEEHLKQEIAQARDASQVPDYVSDISSSRVRYGLRTLNSLFRSEVTLGSLGLEGLSFESSAVSSLAKGKVEQAFSVIDAQKQKLDRAVQRLGEIKPGIGNTVSSRIGEGLPEVFEQATSLADSLSQRIAHHYTSVHDLVGPRIDFAHLSNLLDLS